MRTYLAARYSRREQMVSYIPQLQELGLSVHARWLSGSHQLLDGKKIGENIEQCVEQGYPDYTQIRGKFASDDFEDIKACELLIAFTESNQSGYTSGGRHVETGMAIALSKRVVIVGYRENVFCCLPCVEFYESFTHFINTFDK